MDKKAKQILVKTYWSAAGWVGQQNRQTSLADFEYAKTKGLMFDSLTISKQELIERLAVAVNSVPLQKITDAFLCSLSNKRLDWRSGLASYANAHALLNHDNNIIDYYYGAGSDIDLNVLNFERIKWGGVRHFSGIYNWLDLTLLSSDTVPQPTAGDVAVLRSVLDVISNSADGETPAKLRERLAAAFKGSKNERGVLMEILACAGILRPLRFDRKEPGTHDWTFALH